MANPGFSRGGGANSSGGRGAPTYDFAKYSQKLNTIEIVWAPGVSLTPPLDPAMMTNKDVKISVIKAMLNLFCSSLRKPLFYCLYYYSGPVHTELLVIALALAM